MSKDFDWRNTGQKISMGERVGKILPFLEKTACVHVAERELIAYCEMFKIMFPSEKEFNDWLDKVVIPSFIKLGQGKWYRDTVTDLALALSKRKRKSTTENLGDVLGLTGVNVELPTT